MDENTEFGKELIEPRDSYSYKSEEPKSKNSFLNLRLEPIDQIIIVDLSKISEKYMKTRYYAKENTVEELQAFIQTYVKNLSEKDSSSVQMDL